MRRTIFALLLAGSLLASPALAQTRILRIEDAAPASPRPPIYRDIGRNFMTGADFYFETVGGWFEDLLSLIGLKRHAVSVGDGAVCSASSPCEAGLSCVNTCAGTECERFDKRCVRGASRIQILGEFSPCGAKNLCTDGTDCVRVCQKGLDCADETYRCMKPISPSGSCQADLECAAVCGQQTFPPIGPSAYGARCVRGACECDPLQIKPSAKRVDCPAGTPGILSCPTGTHPACTPGTCGLGDCPAVRTCLTAPAYGGECLSNPECSEAGCSEGAEPFCGDDRHCKCRIKTSQAAACATANDCDDSVCGADELVACVNGGCACAPRGVVSACKSALDCAACPEDYASACENDACVCKRTKVVPFACKTVDECGAVNCPAGYDKGCQNDVCVCSRQVQQP